MGLQMGTARRVVAGGVALAVGASVLLAAVPANAEGAAGLVGGWSEDGRPVEATAPGVGLFGTVNHRGRSETKTIRGTTHKRSHGWTTWTGVQHYTRARLELGWPYNTVIADSGRKWGKSGTEAMTAWKPFRPNSPGSGVGSARTYYGR